MKIKKLLHLALILSFAFTPLLGLASEFNPHYIISDAQMRDKNTMTVETIQRFLESYGSSLANYSDLDFYGNVTPASEIIYNAAQDYDINPQVLLVKLQKEQSLIQNRNPSTYALDWAMGWHRPDNSNPNDPKIQNRKGFGIQVDGAAKLLNWYMINHDLPTYFLRKAGNTYKIRNTDKISDIEVTPANKATAGLYNYTPNIHGNRLFKTIWDRYFSREILNGSLLQAEGEEGVWLLQNGRIRPFASRSALVSRYNPNMIIQIPPTELAKYPIGREIKFPQYALLRIPTGGVYMIDGDTKRPITSMEAFRMIGFNPQEIEDVTLEDLEGYPNGEAITIESVYPTGALVQNNVTGGVYHVINGQRHAIIDRSILNLKFKNQNIIQSSPERLSRFLYVGFARFDDGEIVSPKESDIIYVIENGRKRPFASLDVFESLGYKLENVQELPEDILNRIHSTGLQIDYNF